jgi:hypothetical protein
MCTSCHSRVDMGVDEVDEYSLAVVGACCGRLRSVAGSSVRVGRTYCTCEAGYEFVLNSWQAGMCVDGQVGHSSKPSGVHGEYLRYFSSCVTRHPMLCASCHSHADVRVCNVDEHSLAVVGARGVRSVSTN